MTDLTVLISPMPLGPEPSSFSFGRRSTRPLSKPIMVTLETEVDEEGTEKNPSTESSISEDFLDPPAPHRRRSRSPRVVEPNLLSPPVNTWKSRPKHRPTRSQSAPPERRIPPPVTEGEQPVSAMSEFNRDTLGFKPRNPNRSFTSFTVNRQTTQGGELVRPPPPLFRPTTFWRKTPRSGVTGASYSPATHLIRRSTYIAAGLAFDAPVHDLSALSSDCPNDRKSRLSPRQQTPTPTTDSSTSTTFDFWWPFPLATTASSGSTTSAASSQALNITTLLNSVQSSSSNSPTSTSASLTSLPSQTVTSLSLPISNTSSKHSLNIIEVIPAIVAAGVFLIGLAIWLIYGCCTRRPRIRRDDGELICGPPYRNDDAEREPQTHRDVEERGQQDELIIPKRGHRERATSGQYRWPSYNELPPFDIDAGFRIPDEYKESDSSNDYLTATLLAPPTEPARRSRSSQAKRSFASKRSTQSARQSSTKSPTSDATSDALLELYESDEEKEEHRRATQVPWESLRHKSIKRGILEQVKKENRWMDSIRSSITGGASFLSGRESTKNLEREEEEDRPLHPASGGEMEEQDKVIGKRREILGADFGVSLNPVEAQVAGALKAGPSGHSAEPPNGYSPLPTVPTPAARRTFVQLKDDPQEQDKYTPIPTRTTPTHRNNRSRSRSRSQSASPMKRTAYRANYRPLTGENEAGGISRDVLPSSPPQLMSPPLESQICFTPPLRSHELVPGALPTQLKKTVMTMPTPTPTTSRAQVRSTKNPSPRKSRKLHSRTPPQLPFPGSGGAMTSRPDAYRGRLLKKQKSTKGADPISEKKASGGPSAAHNEGDVEGNTALKKVDRIIQSSWSARDLVE